MKFLVGDRSRFAIECHVFPDSNPLEGKVFLYVDGKRFGDGCFDENLSDFFCRVRDYLSFITGEYADLFKLKGHDFYEFFLCMRDEHEHGEACSRYSNFESASRFGQIDLDLVIRAEYAFDHCFLALIPYKNEERFFAKQDSSKECADAVLARGHCTKLFSEMAEMLSSQAGNAWRGSELI